jgi:hypothetical protein
MGFADLVRCIADRALIDRRTVPMADEELWALSQRLSGVSVG